MGTGFVNWDNIGHIAMVVICAIGVITMLVGAFARDDDGTRRANFVVIVAGFIIAAFPGALLWTGW